MDKYMKMSRFWAMPSECTFDIPPIHDLVKRYLSKSTISVDPFSRNKRWATYTNDMNPNTDAEYHKPASVFLRWLSIIKIQSDLILFDPPYSVQQSKQVYDSYGVDGFTGKDAQNVGHWTVEKNLCYKILSPGGIFIHFGWHSNGMGKGRDMEIIELLLVAHGRSHNDTIVTVERKIAHQSSLFDMVR